MLWIIPLLATILLSTAGALFQRYKRVSPDQVLVIYGRTRAHTVVGSDGIARKSARASRCYHGGAAFVIPGWEDVTAISGSSDSRPLRRVCVLYGKP